MQGFTAFSPHGSDGLSLEVHVQQLWNPWPNAFDRTLYFLGARFSHYDQLNSCSNSSLSMFLKILFSFIEHKGLACISVLRFIMILSFAEIPFRKA